MLLVEDEAGVRHYVRDVLEANGYRALDATTGADAIGIARHYTGPIHLLITDVVLPGMNGEELIREFLALRPGVPVLRMSGYSELVGVRMKGGAEYLRKPFTPSVLLHTMRGILDAGRAASAAPA